MEYSGYRSGQRKKPATEAFLLAVHMRVLACFIKQQSEEGLWTKSGRRPGLSRELRLGGGPGFLGPGRSSPSQGLSCVESHSQPQKLTEPCDDPGKARTGASWPFECKPSNSGRPLAQTRAPVQASLKIEGAKQSRTRNRLRILSGVAWTFTSKHRKNARHNQQLFK